jgi:CBS domain-containing protein
METQIREVLGDKGQEVITTGADATVSAAVSLMNDRRIGAVVVVDRGGTPIGMFSERDVLQRVVARGRDPDTATVREVMTTPLVVVSPDITVGEAMVVITERRTRHLPVVEDGVLVGLISSGDLTHWVIRDQAREISDLVCYMQGPYYEPVLSDAGPPAASRRQVAARGSGPRLSGR